MSGSHLRNHRVIMYRLKRDYGKTMLIYRPTQNVNDVTTGQIIRGYDVVKVRLAPILPSRIDRSFVYDLDYIQAGNNFTEGAYFDRNSRMVLLDARDLPKGFIPNLDDFVIIEPKRYDVRVVQAFEDEAMYTLKIATVENQDSEKWMYTKNIVNFALTAEETVE